MSGTAAGTLFAPSIEQQAVRDRGHASNVLVAAAGSGKTRVLTWLYTDAHVGEGIPLDQLLAITFTEKAAGELRSRIAKELSEHSLGREPDLSDAWIGTFHGVCARILREFAHRRGLDPAFGVIEELQALELQVEAWERAVGRLLDDQPGEAGSLLAQVGDTALRSAIIEWWKARRSAGEVHPVLPTPRTEVEDVVAACGRLIRAAAAYGDAVEEVQDARTNPSKSLAERLEVAAQITELAGRAARLAQGGELGSRAVDEITSALDRLSPRKGNPMPSEHPEREALLEARTLAQRRIAEFVAAPRVALLAELVRGFSVEYEACKRRDELLDFDDLELEALQLLREDDDVRLRLVERFERVLVDEFQDTNPRQAELVDLIAGGPMWIPVGGDGRPAVTVVGDPRQAIYGFRYADVKLIADAADRIGEEGELRLSTNYRSDAEVLTAIDEAFAQLDPTHEPVTAFRGPDQLPSGQARVELLVTKEEPGTKAAPLPSWDEIDLGAQIGEKDGPALAEARLVAARIEELRAAEPERSIVVLARARSILGPIAEALADLEIPALIDGAEGFWERLEVADLLAWLRLVRNPADDAALLAVCASPVVGLTTDGLAALGMLDHESGSARVDALRRALASGTATFSADDAGRLRETLALVELQREPGRAADPAGMLDEVMLATAYDEHLLRLVGGDRRLANVVRLRRLASEIASGGGDLTDVVERAEREQGHELRAPEASVAGSDAITLMTVHQAKGLEFDTVIVAGLGAQRPSSSPALLGDPRPGGTRLGLRLRPSPGVKARPLFDHDELMAELEAREDDELRRVLYVALTRAKERLIVSGTATWTQKGSPFSREPSKSSGVLTWLAPAMVPEIDALVASSGGAPIRTRGGIELRVSEPDGPTLPAARRAPEVLELPVHVGEGPRLDRVPPSQVAPLGPAHVLSYTALAAQEVCGLRFHVERVLGLRSAPEPPALLREAPVVREPLPPEASTESIPRVAADPQREATAPSERISFASAKAPAGQADLFSLLDEPVLPPGPVETAPRAAPLEPSLFSAEPPPLDEPRGLRTPGHPPPSAADLGNAVHAILERLSPRASAEEIGAAVSTVTNEPAWAADPAARGEVTRLVEVALGSRVVADLWAEGAPRRELPFTVAVGSDGDLITGILDAWAPAANGSALVVDYKTDAVRDGDDLERKTAERYTLQRKAYALAALRAGATEVRVVHLFLRDAAGASVSVTYTQAEAARLDADLALAASEARADGPRATASPDVWTCDACPARGTLCGWPLADTQRPPGSGRAPREHWQGDPRGVRTA